jgi:cobalt-precorrin-5B (C1)-methyltransferase
VVVVAEASRANEKIVRGTLGDIAAKIAADPIERTALILVGRVLAAEAFAKRIVQSNTAAEAFGHAKADGIALGDAVAKKAWATAADMLRDTPIELEIAVFDRDGTLVGHALPARVHD